MPTVSDESARLLLQLLDQVTLSGSQPDLEEAAALVAQARRELLTGSADG